MEIKTIINKWDLSKLKSFHKAKETINEVKRQLPSHPLNLPAFPPQLVLLCWWRFGPVLWKHVQCVTGRNPRPKCCEFPPAHLITQFRGRFMWIGCFCPEKGVSFPQPSSMNTWMMFFPPQNSFNSPVEYKDALFQSSLTLVNGFLNFFCHQGRNGRHARHPLKTPRDYPYPCL